MSAAEAKVISFTVDASGVEEGGRRIEGAMTKAATASDKALAAEARLQAAMDKHAAASDGLVRASSGLEAQTDRIAQAQARASTAYAASVKASNDNVAALQKQSSAYAEVGKWAAAHPVLVLAGSVAAARALSGLATSAAGSLGAASASTAAFAQGAAGMGAGVVAAATLASRGLGLASTAAAASAVGLGRYAETVSGLTTTTGLLSRGLSLLPGFLGPVGAAFAVFQLGSMAISKAADDLDRLIAIGEKARGLDVSAPFLKSFESLGQKIEATTDQMDKALQQASGFVKERYGQASGALSAVSNLYTQGAFGAEKPAAMSALETATTTQEKVRATLDLVKELYDRGQDFAGLDLAEKLMGPDVAERLRTGQANISQIVADLNSLQDKEVLKQDQVDRALELNKNIAETKQGISDALAVTFDFSGAALAANEAWLKVLQTVLLVIQKINEANQASSDFVGTTTTTMIEGLKSAGSAAVDLAQKYGILAKAKAEAEVQGPPEVQGPEFKITAKQFPYNFGPTLADLPKVTGGAKQAQQAAQDAVSAYDNLIQKTKDRIEELDLEAASVGKDTDAVIKLKLAHDMERAAKKDGIEVTAQMRAETDRLGTSLAASTDNLAKAKRGLELTRDAQRELADDFSTLADDVVLGGKKIGQAFADLSKTLASSSLKALLTGQGGLAGLFGTAGEKSGDIGGLLGGKLNLGGLLGGSDPAGSPLPGAQGPSLPNSSLFGDLFDGDKITKALGLGAETGIGSALSNSLKPKGTGGILSSPLGGAIASVGAGASVGFSSQSPLMGALGGGLAGLATGNPLLAVAGAGAGAVGNSCSPKGKAHVARQRIRLPRPRRDADGQLIL